LADGPARRSWGINFFRFADGQFVERYGTWDVVTFMRQLGLMPAPAGPAQ
jgi:hypothetical protein